MTKQQFYKFVLFTVFFITSLFWANNLNAQTRDLILKQRIDSLANINSGLNQIIELSFNKAPIQEIIRSIAVSNKLNIIIDPLIQNITTYNFTDVQAKDVLLFLCREYNLDVSNSGKIIKISKYENIKQLFSKPLLITFDSIKNTLTADLKSDTLAAVTKMLTSLTGNNILCTPDIRFKLVSMYCRDVSLKELLDNLALTNNLYTQENAQTFLLKEMGSIESANTNTSPKKGKEKSTGSIFAQNIKSAEDISLVGSSISLNDAIIEISNKLKVNYILVDDIDGLTNLNLSHVSYEELLTNLLNGTKFSFQKLNNLYIIGDRTKEGIRSSTIIKLQNRSINGIVDVLPESIKKDLTIKEFPELNCLIVTGSEPPINELKSLIGELDVVVPLVMIEVMIIDNQTDFNVTTGIEAGISDQVKKSGGTFLSGIDYTLNGNSISKLLNSFNGFGSANLGKVNQNFYITLKALETQGIVKVRSTPILTTLNGHEATLKIGNTQYYIEQTTNFIVTQSTQQTTVKQYKSVNADFSLTIKPYVSGDDQITLEIKVDQSDFSERIEATAPPGQISRNFNSLIRVRNDEMILLGGLETKTDRTTSNGVPLLSRIPIIKWFFSSRTKEKKSTKLNIFIKPTIIY